MARKFNDKEIVDLLGRWNRQDPEYPSASREKRRAAFLASAASLLVGGLAKASLTGKSASALGHASAPMTTGMKIAIGILSTSILAVGSYVGVLIYNERETLIDLFRGGNASTQTAVIPTNSLFNPTGTPVPSFTPTGTVTLPSSLSATPMPAPEGTPTPQILPTSTPIPPKPTDNGNHYGQTKTPKPKPTSKPPKPTKTPH